MPPVAAALAALRHSEDTLAQVRLTRVQALLNLFGGGNTGGACVFYGEGSYTIGEIHRSSRVEMLITFTPFLAFELSLRSN